MTTELKNLPPLTEEQRREVLRNIRLVHYWARRFKYRRRMLDYDDLVQAGTLGLMRSLQLYDGSSASFGTYASLWIRSWMNRAAKQQRYMLTTYRPTWKLKKETLIGLPPLLRALDRGFEPDESHRPHWLMRERLDFLDPLRDRHTPEDDAVEYSTRMHVRRVLATMPPRQRYVLERRIGLFMDDMEPESLESIGQTLGITRERVRQIENKALELFRKRYQNLTPDEEDACLSRPQPRSERRRYWKTPPTRS